MNNKFTAVNIDDTFAVYQTAEKVSFELEVIAEVESIWNKAKKENKRLFDGECLCAIKCSTTELICHASSYRFFYAQQVNAQLKEVLDLKSVAVSGLVSLDGQYFVAKRANDVLQFPNRLELVPSGSLPAAGVVAGTLQIDFRSHLLCELREEVNIKQANVKSVQPFLLVDDNDSGVVDICCSISLQNIDVDEITMAFSKDEYTELQAHSVSDLQSMVSKCPDNWVSASVAIIKTLR